MFFANKYEVMRTLGQGAFGIVYEARDSFLDRTVAVKTLRQDAISCPETRAAFHKRFLNEARTAARLNHINIVAIYEAGSSGDDMYLAMEYVPGRTLRQELDAKGALGVDVALRFAEQLLTALAFAHDQAVVHRDIKPENIMIRPDGVVKVADFGIAKVVQANQGTLTQDGTVLGTPGYMAPEQILSQPVDARTDLFSAAAVIYEMLAGERPFNADSIPALLYKILSEDPAPLSLRHTIPPHVEAAILGGMAKKPEERFASCREMLEAIRTPGARTSPATQPEASERGSEERVRVKNAPTIAFKWIAPVQDRSPEETGSLDETPSVELLLEIGRRKFNGMLVVESTNHCTGLEFSRGALFGANGGPPASNLSLVMLKIGCLDRPGLDRIQAELTRTTQAGRKPPPLGYVAVQMGLLTHAELFQALEAQVRARVEAVLDLTAGTYSLYPDLFSGHWQQMASKSSEPLVANWMAAHPERAAALVDRFRELHARSTVRRSSQTAELFARFHLGPQIQRAVHRGEGRSLTDLLLAAGDRRDDVARALYLLWAAGGLQLSQTPSSSRAILSDRSRRPSSGVYALTPSSSRPRVEPLPSRPATPPRPTPRSAPRVERLPQVVSAPSNPPPGTPAAREQARQKLAEGAAASESGQHETAVEVLSDARKLSPRDSGILAALAWAKFRSQPGDLGVREESKRLLEAALAIEPTHIPSMLHLARIARMEDRLSQALIYLNRARHLAPDNDDLKAEGQRIDKLLQRKSDRYRRSGLDVDSL